MTETNILLSILSGIISTSFGFAAGYLFGRNRPNPNLLKSEYYEGRISERLGFQDKYGDEK